MLTRRAFGQRLAMALPACYFVPPVCRAVGPELIAVRLVFRAGSAWDPPGFESLAFVTAQALLVSPLSSVIGSGEVSGLARSWGAAAVPRVAVGKDTTTLALTLPVEGAASYARAILDPLFRDATLATSTLVDLQEAARAALSDLACAPAGDLALLLHEQALYRTSPYAHVPPGRRGSVDALTCDKVRAFFGSFYQLENVALHVSTIDSGVIAALQQSLEQLPFAALRRRSEILPSLALPLCCPPTGGGRYVLTTPHPDTSFATTGAPLTIAPTDARFPALLLLGAILATDSHVGRSSHIGIGSTFFFAEDGDCRVGAALRRLHTFHTLLDGASLDELVEWPARVEAALHLMALERFDHRFRDIRTRLVQDVEKMGQNTWDFEPTRVLAGLSRDWLPQLARRLSRTTSRAVAQVAQAELATVIQSTIIVVPESAGAGVAERLARTSDGPVQLQTLADFLGS